MEPGFEGNRQATGRPIALTPISTASAILQATPLVVVLGAALLFGEKVSGLRWALITNGFLGVMIILRPGAEGFSALSLLALIAMAGFAGRDLATRAAPLGLSTCPACSSLRALRSRPCRWDSSRLIPPRR